MKKALATMLSIAVLLTLGISAVAEGNVLKVGMEGTYAPYTYHDDSGTLTGFEVDVANAIGEKIGYSVEFVEGAWDSLFPALDAGNIDVIMNQVTITEARLETYDFSTPYVYTRPVVIVAADNDSIASFEDLNGKKAAEGLTSNYNELAKRYGAEIIGQDIFALALELVKGGEADAVVNDELTYAYWQVTTGDYASTKIAARSDEATSSAVVIQKGREALRDAISGAIDELLADGTIAGISEKYFNIDVSQK
ncbi:MAG: transporter substrate-binding domain-containing protein [bacterium]